MKALLFVLMSLALMTSQAYGISLPSQEAFEILKKDFLSFGVHSGKSPSGEDCSLYFIDNKEYVVLSFSVGSKVVAEIWSNQTTSYEVNDNEIRLWQMDYIDFDGDPKAEPIYTISIYSSLGLLEVKGLYENSNSNNVQGLCYIEIK